MYDNLSSRLRGEAEVSDASPYIKELMKQAADSLDNLNIAVQKLTNKDAPTIIQGEGWACMSILIRGMEMPTRCGRCDMCITESDGDIDFHKACCITGAVIENLGEKMEDCPLVHVPPHGRLIEKNAVFELIRSFPNVDRQLPVEFMKALYELPTILEAEEGE